MRSNITEIETSGFTEAIVWSVEVSSVGDLNFNGEFPLTSGGVYVGNRTYPDFPANMAQLKQGTVKRVTFSRWLLELRRLGRHHRARQSARNRPDQHPL